MNPDWDIVDEDPAESPSPSANDENPFSQYELNNDRIGRVIRERRAADRLRLWRIAIAIFIALCVTAIAIDIFAWLTR